MVPTERPTEPLQALLTYGESCFHHTPEHPMSIFLWYCIHTKYPFENRAQLRIISPLRTTMTTESSSPAERVILRQRHYVRFAEPREVLLWSPENVFPGDAPWF